MKYRILGQTGLFVSELSLGTMTIGAGNDFFRNIGNLKTDETAALLKLFLDAGGNLIDTANYYSDGASETVLGEAINILKPAREDLILATKARLRIGEGPNAVGLSRQHIFAEVEKSLKRLKTDYIDLFQLHGVDELTPMEETLRALDDLVRSGKVRYTGVCNFAAWQIMKALGISGRAGITRIQSAQMHYSLAARDIEREVVPVCLDQSVGVMAWSPLSGGYLSGKYADTGNAEGRRNAFPFPPIPDRGPKCLDALGEVSAKHGASPAQVALAYLLEKPAITTVIIGARNTNQLQANLSALEVDLDQDDMALLDNVSALEPEYPGWMIDRQRADRLVGAAAISDVNSVK